jgi:hypothetical protein
MDKQEIENLSELYFNLISEYYGMSKHHATLPYISIEDSRYSDGEDKETKGEYCNLHNEIVIYWKNIEDEESLIRTIIHEYQHYLQSPTWFTRYYKQGYNYNDHPYEIQALQEEINWKKFKINRL